MTSPDSYTTPQAQELAKAFNAFIEENFGSRKNAVLYRSEALDTFIDTLRDLDTHLTQQNRMLYAALHRGSSTFRRADGSHIYRPADEVLYLPETTAAALLNS